MLRVDGARLWADLMHSATVGGTPAGGIDRQALTAEDATIRAWFAREAASLGGTVTADRLGTQWAIFPGAGAGDPIVIGSHLDTQPTGGRFDGVLGVLAGLACVRALRHAGQTTRHPLAVVNWTNEEGARFTPAMLASGVHAGVFTEDFALARADRDGMTVAQALSATGQAGAMPPGAQRMAAYFELHIEQGPVLEDTGQDIGVVTGVQAMRQVEITLTGVAAHAGTTPMARRRDPVRAFAALVPGIMALAERDPGRGRVTIGQIAVRPGVKNTIPEHLVFSVDLRHPTDAGLADMSAGLEMLLPSAAETGCAAACTETWLSPLVAFAPALVEAVRDAARALGARAAEIVSGAGHDAVYAARVAPAAMIFTPCRGGISHHPDESITPEEAARGADVLLQAVLRADAILP